MARTILPTGARFWSKTRTALTGCVEWTGSITSTGYGSFYAGPGQYVIAHRWAYTQAHGAIPPGMHLDHLCRNRKCVKPEHLEPVTPRENLLRGDTVTARHVKATHCPVGHPYSGPNLYIAPSTGYRSCRTCARAQRLARDARKKE